MFGCIALLRAFHGKWRAAAKLQYRTQQASLSTDIAMINQHTECNKALCWKLVAKLLVTNGVLFAH